MSALNSFKSPEEWPNKIPGSWGQIEQDENKLIEIMQAINKVNDANSLANFGRKYENLRNNESYKYNIGRMLKIRARILEKNGGSDGDELHIVHEMLQAAAILTNEVISTLSRKHEFTPTMSKMGGRRRSVRRRNRRRNSTRCRRRN